MFTTSTSGEEHALTRPETTQLVRAPKPEARNFEDATHMPGARPFVAITLQEQGMCIWIPGPGASLVGRLAPAGGRFVAIAREERVFEGVGAGRVADHARDETVGARDPDERADRAQVGHHDTPRRADRRAHLR